MKWWILLILPCIITANPIFTEVINEFLVEGSSSDCIELRYLASPTIDTVYTAILPLINTLVVTPAGSSFIDTNIFLHGPECLAIDGSVLGGSFWLPYNSGYAKMYNDSISVWDSIFYPGHSTVWPVHAPTPPTNCSSAKFHCFVYDSLGWYHPWWWKLTDWYVDYTPTFGTPNDDYPGCEVSGYVYDSNLQPLGEALVTASIDEWFGIIYNPQGHHKYCTTYTWSDGSFSFDSLLPYHYYIVVSADGYPPDTHYTGILCCTDPLTNLCFNLQTGIAEYGDKMAVGGLSVYPNPFHNILYITASEADEIGKIYDITGELVGKIENMRADDIISFDGRQLPAGVYFLYVAEKKIKVIKL